MLKVTILFFSQTSLEREEGNSAYMYCCKNLVARRRRVLNVAVLLVLLISQLNNITVLGPVRSFRRVKRSTGMVGQGMLHIFRRTIQENVSSVEINISLHSEPY